MRKVPKRQCGMGQVEKRLSRTNQTVPRPGTGTARRGYGGDTETNRAGGGSQSILSVLPGTQFSLDFPEEVIILSPECRANHLIEEDLKMNIRPARQWKFYCGCFDKNGNDVNITKYRVAMGSFFDAYNEQSSYGVWKGTGETCLVFTVIDVENKLSREHILAVAELLKKQGNQESIMVVREVVEVGFV